MPPAPAQAWLNIGDALLQVAPHNVLASMFSGGQVTVIPVMGRQPTIYEEMYRIPTLRAGPAPAPSPAAPTGFDAGVDLLRFAPHNVLMALFSGGQPPGMPGVEAPPVGVSLVKFSKVSGNHEWDPSNMALRLDSGAAVVVTAPSDVGLVITHQKVKRQTTDIGIWMWPTSIPIYERLPTESDAGFVPTSPPEQAVIEPQRTKVVYETRNRSETFTGTWGINIKRKVVDYATIVTLVGVVPVPKAPKAPVEPRVPTLPTPPLVVPTAPVEVPEVPAGPTPEELQAQAAAEARRKAEEEARRRQIAQAEELERQTAETEARMQAEREQRAAELEEGQAKAREELEARIVQRREAEALEEARKEAEQQAQVEAFKKKMEEQRQAREAAKAERAASVEEISVRAAALRQEAARRKLGRSY